MNNDITKCSNHTCKKKSTCLRFMIPSSIRQSYCYFELDEEGNCDHFVSMKNKPTIYREEDDKNED